jgi:hypothetical protein
LDLSYQYKGDLLYMKLRTTFSFRQLYCGLNPCLDEGANGVAMNDYRPYLIIGECNNDSSIRHSHRGGNKHQRAIH